MTRILIAEDEPRQRSSLVELLREFWPDAELVECEHGEGALRAAEEEAPDVAFLDIRMPGISGLDVAERLPASTHVVFVTAHEDSALAAFERGAVDYLLKPVLRERLRKTVERLRSRSLPLNLGPLVSELREALGERPAALQWVTASAGDTVRLFAIDDILAFRAQDKYTEVLTRDGDATIRTSLRELRTQLDEKVFWQVHRSALVRVQAIEWVQKGRDGRYRLKLRGREDELPVSPAFRKRFRAM